MSLSLELSNIDDITDVDDNSFLPKRSFISFTSFLSTPIYGVEPSDVYLITELSQVETIASLTSLGVISFEVLSGNKESTDVMSVTECASLLVAALKVYV